MSIDHVGSVLGSIETRMKQLGVTKLPEEQMPTVLLMATLIVELRAIHGILTRIDTTLASARN